LHYVTFSSTFCSFHRPAAGKTGTTDHNQDAWFVGYTPQYTAAVWMGNPVGEIPMTNVGGIRVFGATYPAQIWRKFMTFASGPLPPLDFQPPDKGFTRSRFITELGRKVTFRSSSPPVPAGPVPVSNATPTTGPAAAPPVSTATKKKRPPVTVPKHTSPPSTAAPGP
jgi:membrane peptidoglycan carboxypeptidase